MSVIIWHNPACSTSRKVLARIRDAGIEPQVVEYLKARPGADELRKTVARLGIPARDLVRKKGKLHAELGLDDPALTDEKAIDAMAAHPELIERPVVMGAKRAVVARPVERVDEIL